MKRYRGIIGFIKMKYEQFLIREIDRLDLGWLWADNDGAQIEDEYIRFEEMYKKK